jgi:XTP/dITP diphosphohydrolase
MAREIVLATGNSGKIREIKEMLADLGVTVLSQSQFGIKEAEETASTFVENALIKARHAAAWTKRPVLADDSGLEVDALDGAPGVHSAYYAGRRASDRENMEKLLRDLSHVPEAQRTARFHCVMVFLRHPEDPTPLICYGIWEGRILFEPRGTKGFGYDPVFYVPTHGCSAAELPPEVKNHLSHRGQAQRKLRRAMHMCCAAVRLRGEFS